MIEQQQDSSFKSSSLKKDQRQGLRTANIKHVHESQTTKSVPRRQDGSIVNDNDK
jgi:hypothetical protein